jgi:hypothetical protein
LDIGPPTLVVQGQIETNVWPFVMLTNTVGYFSTIDLSTLQNSFIHKDKAVVKVSDGTNTFTLREYSIDTGVNHNQFYFYSVDTADLAALAFVGHVEKFYTLTINYNGTTYTSTTKIPNPKPLDSVWAGKPFDSSRRTPLLAKSLYFNYTDPDTPGNYVRYFTKKPHKPFIAGVRVFNDQIINGIKVVNNFLEPGDDGSVNNGNVDSSGYFFVGDTVVVKWCYIDKPVYTFWNTYLFSLNSVGNPFASPINAQSNISNGALGVWAGYGSTFDTLIVK